MQPWQFQYKIPKKVSPKKIIGTILDKDRQCNLARLIEAWFNGKEHSKLSERNHGTQHNIYIYFRYVTQRKNYMAIRYRKAQKHKFVKQKEIDKRQESI